RAPELLWRWGARPAAPSPRCTAPPCLSQCPSALAGKLSCCQSIQSLMKIQPPFIDFLASEFSFSSLLIQFVKDSQEDAPVTTQHFRNWCKRNGRAQPPSRTGSEWPRCKEGLRDYWGVYAKSWSKNALAVPLPNPPQPQTKKVFVGLVISAPQIILCRELFPLTFLKAVSR
uniref:Uncharacterized protein n=1 Tax=Colobus angolensis palliatus TaxID=336983 RepID=A0A2K5K2U9_COLAP